MTKYLIGFAAGMMDGVFVVRMFQLYDLATAIPVSILFVAMSLLAMYGIDQET